MRIYLVILLAGVSLFSVGCGGGSTPKTAQTPPPATYTIGGSVSGLAGTGLVLQDNSGDNLPVSASATKFTFPTPVSSGSSYKVSVMTQPSSPIQDCVVSSASGTANANITTVSVACTTVTYTVGGTISGLVGTGLVLQNNNGDNLPVTANATGFTFATPVNSGTSYKVAGSHPAFQPHAELCGHECQRNGKRQCRRSEHRLFHDHLQRGRHRLRSDWNRTRPAEQ